MLSTTMEHSNRHVLTASNHKTFIPTNREEKTDWTFIRSSAPGVNHNLNRQQQQQQHPPVVISLNGSIEEMIGVATKPKGESSAKVRYAPSMPIKSVKPSVAHHRLPPRVVRNSKFATTTTPAALETDRSRPNDCPLPSPLGHHQQQQQQQQQKQTEHFVKTETKSNKTKEKSTSRDHQQPIIDPRFVVRIRITSDSEEDESSDHRQKKKGSEKLVQCGASFSDFRNVGSQIPSVNNSPVKQPNQQKQCYQTGQLVNVAPTPEAVIANFASSKHSILKGHHPPAVIIKINDYDIPDQFLETPSSSSVSSKSNSPPGGLYYEPPVFVSQASNVKGQTEKESSSFADTPITFHYNVLKQNPCPPTASSSSVSSDSSPELAPRKQLPLLVAPPKPPTPPPENRNMLKIKKYEKPSKNQQSSSSTSAAVLAQIPQAAKQFAERQSQRPNASSPSSPPPAQRPPPPPAPPNYELHQKHEKLVIDQRGSEKVGELKPIIAETASLPTASSNNTMAAGNNKLKSRLEQLRNKCSEIEGLLRHRAHEIGDRRRQDRRSHSLSNVDREVKLSCLASINSDKLMTRSPSLTNVSGCESLITLTTAEKTPASSRPISVAETFTSSTTVIEPTLPSMAVCETEEESSVVEPVAVESSSERRCRLDDEPSSSPTITSPPPFETLTIEIPRARTQSIVEMDPSGGSDAEQQTGNLLLITANEASSLPGIQMVRQRERSQFYQDVYGTAPPPIAPTAPPLPAHHQRSLQSSSSIFDNLNRRQSASGTLMGTSRRANPADLVEMVRERRRSELLHIDRMTMRDQTTSIMASHQRYSSTLGSTNRSTTNHRLSLLDHRQRIFDNNRRSMAEVDRSYNNAQKPTTMTENVGQDELVREADERTEATMTPEASLPSSNCPMPEEISYSSEQVSEMTGIVVESHHATCSSSIVEEPLIQQQTASRRTICMFTSMAECKIGGDDEDQQKAAPLKQGELKAIDKNDVGDDDDDGYFSRRREITTSGPFFSKLFVHVNSEQQTPASESSADGQNLSVLDHQWL